MAQRRMFSLKIVSSDAFLDMPSSSRELYFQLGMYADDDGFVNPKKIIRMINASEDDLNILIGKRFVLKFDNGVVVIKHWLINNLIRKDFYQKTVYSEQKKLIIVKENNSYTECKQNVNKMLTQLNIIKLNKNNIATEKTNKKDSKISSILVSVLKEFSPTGELDGDYQIDNIFPAKLVAKQIVKFTGKALDINNPEHYKEIEDEFRGFLSKLDSFDRNKATKMSYIKFNFNSLAAKIISKNK